MNYAQWAKEYLSGGDIDCGATVSADTSEAGTASVPTVAMPAMVSGIGSTLTTVSVTSGAVNMPTTSPMC
jgi:hypothetical protein